jgi:multiple sugar transport system substrate-binding protein/putative aldouronate transport system substrate-binding protein
MKKIVSILAILAITTSVFTGCNKVTEEVVNSGNLEEKSTITIFGNELQNYDGVDKDRVWDEIEKKTNTKIELSGAPITGYIEKISVMINTGEAPDLFFFLPERSEAYSKWVQQEMIKPIDNYIKDGSKYPNIYKILSNSQYKNLTYENKYTIVPYIAPENNWAVYIRSDWLDNLKLKTPETIDEYLDVMKKFTFNDPDKNGKNDTYGLTSSKGIYWFMPFYAAFVKKPDWNYSIDKKTMEFMYLTKEYKQYLGVMAKAYADGLIVKDFYSKIDDMKIEDFATGKAGIMVHNASSHMQNIMQKLEQASPNAKIDVILPPKGPAGANMHGWGGWWGGYSISSNCKNVDAALRVLDYMVSEEGGKLRYYGIENIHYTNTDKGSVISDKNLLERNKEPKGRFGLVKNGTEEKALGNYVWGTNLGFQYKMLSGKIVAFEDFSNYKYKDLASKAQEMVKPVISSSDMMNITVNGAEFAQINKKINDQASIFTTNIIVGRKTVEEGWQEFVDMAKSLKYDKAQKLAFDTMQNVK